MLKVTNKEDGSQKRLTLSAVSFVADPHLSVFTQFEHRYDRRPRIIENKAQQANDASMGILST